jgi:Reverse transcriptase (RNA-dependent DNA polymerase)/RNase H-like domain found in reverse transcriptase
MRRETIKKNERDNEDKFKKKLQIGEMESKEREIMERIVNEYKEIFEYDIEKIGKTDLIKHRIIVEGDQGPIAQKKYRETGDRAKFISKEIDNLLEMGKIRESYSPWASPVTLAGKKSGNYRFCIDYRKLNKVTKSDAYPLPRIDELLERYETARWFTSLDLAAGYHQVEMEEEDKEKTAFICSRGLFEYNVMPFGLKNAPGTFQRLMDKILREYINEFVVVYLDDIMIYSDSFENHVKHVREVLERLKRANLILKLKKCKFGEQNIEFLGHIIGREGIKPDPKKIEKIINLKAPKDVSGIRSILGLCSYYRRFVKDFSKIAKPLTSLLKKGVSFEWKEKQEKALEELKKRLTEYPLLQQPKMDKEFVLITDASGVGLGAILSQLNDEGKEIVIAYASRTMNEAEQKYPITDMECLAIVWAIKYFHKFLIGGKFKVITDHAALKGLMDAKIPKGRRARWVMELQQYSFDVIHRAGKENKNADALSRLV